jgi:FMN reductase
VTAPFTAVVVGNPKPASRTLHAATFVATELAGHAPDLIVDLAEVGAALLDWQSTDVGDLVEQVARADLVIVASPTYKATYSGLLKLFLDRFAAGQLTGVAVPLMLGGGPAHALAPDLTLAPLLTHLGGLAPTGGLYVLDKAYDDPAAYATWLERARPVVAALTARAGHARSR